ncbi:hypothetical protein [Paenibacillus sp. FSL R5-0490]|uniref:hypothetical protein n=1 Tax=Bacillales TaxID=1385 RepID=UPI00158A4533|nr:hypothetical protein [Paenibacillus sp. FSL R5-0490]
MRNRKAGTFLRKKEKRKPGWLREISDEILDSIAVEFFIRIILWIPRLIISFLKNVF